MFVLAVMSLGLNIRVRERRFVCGVLNCHQKFVSASAVARHVARAHQTGATSNDKAQIWTLYLHTFLGCTMTVADCWMLSPVLLCLFVIVLVA